MGRAGRLRILLGGTGVLAVSTVVFFWVEDAGWGYRGRRSRMRRMWRWNCRGSFSSLTYIEGVLRFGLGGLCMI